MARIAILCGAHSVTELRERLLLERDAMAVRRTDIPKTYEKDIMRAVEILREGGCSQVFVFGSSAAGRTRHGSDLDLAIRGCPQGSFFHLMGKLMMELDHPVDLVDLDTQHSFADYLEAEDELVEVG